MRGKGSLRALAIGIGYIVRNCTDNSVMRQTIARFSWYGRTAVLCLLLSVLPGCQQQEPLRIGLVTGLTGHYSLMGISTRNGVILAIEEANATGGIQGRSVELIIRDDQQDPRVARLAVSDLLTLGVEVIIGPATSSMAMSVVDLVNAKQMLMVGTFVSTNQLSGLDDYFVRVMPPTSYSASCVGDYLQSQLGYTKFAVIYDKSNSSFTEVLAR